MPKAPITYSEAVQAAVDTYMTSLFAGESKQQRQISDTTSEHGLPTIDVRPYEGYFLLWLAKLINAKRILEIGTLAGYSGTWLAQALPPDGKLITLELDQKHADVARRNFEVAGVSNRVEIRVGNAHEALKNMTESFDMAFIDAEKEGYPAYLDWALDHVRVGGIIAAHNALRGGKVATPEDQDEYARNMDSFNRRMAAEPRLLSLIFPAGDGTIVGIKQS